MEVLPAIACGQPVAAVGATGCEGIFVTLVPGKGLRYLCLEDASGDWQTADWQTAGSFKGTVCGEFGLHHYALSDELATISFVDASAACLVCLQVPSAGQCTQSEVATEAVIVEQCQLPSKVIAVCRISPKSDKMAVALANGAIQFVSLATGKLLGKAIRPAHHQAGQNITLAGLEADCESRVVALRQASAGSQVDVFVVDLDAAAEKASVRMRGVLTGKVPEGALLGSMPASSSSGDRLLACFAPSSTSSGRKFVSIVINTQAEGCCTASVENLATSASENGSWLVAQGYLVDVVRRSKEVLLEAIDARYGITLASATLGSTNHRVQDEGKSLLRCASYKDFSIIADPEATELKAIRWRLPTFSLKKAFGSKRVVPTGSKNDGLRSVDEALALKRPYTDTKVNDLFSASKRAATEAAMLERVRESRWLPSEELVDLIAQRRCFSVAHALLEQPELSEAFCVRLLAADPSFESPLLNAAVQRPSTEHALEIALADHLPSSLLPGLLEVLLEWLGAYSEIPLSTLEERLPGLPRQTDIVHFLSALADACLPSLVRLDHDLLERVTEALTHVQRRRSKLESMHSIARAAARLASAEKAAEAPMVEVSLLDF